MNKCNYVAFYNTRTREVRLSSNKNYFLFPHRPSKADMYLAFNPENLNPMNFHTVSNPKYDRFASRTSIYDFEFRYFYVDNRNQLIEWHEDFWSFESKGKDHTVDYETQSIVAWLK